MEKRFFTFTTGALGYGGLEILWRGYTHWTMLLAGGICLLGLCHIYRLALPFWLQCVAGSAMITAVEFAAGCVCNLWLHWNVWDYSARFGNVAGQICPLYSLIWLAISAIVFLALHWLEALGPAAAGSSGAQH